MTDVRSIDLAQPPDPKREVRLQADDCVISIWLPAALEQLGKAIEALGAAGFDIADDDG